MDRRRPSRRADHHVCFKKIVCRSSEKFKNHYDCLRSVWRQEEGAGETQVGPQAPFTSFTIEEDERILDISNNPSYVNYVEHKQRMDRHRTVTFVGRAPAQLQDHYHYLRIVWMQQENTGERQVGFLHRSQTMKFHSELWSSSFHDVGRAAVDERLDARLWSNYNKIRNSVKKNNIENINSNIKNIKKPMGRSVKPRKLIKTHRRRHRRHVGTVCETEAVTLRR